MAGTGNKSVCISHFNHHNAIICIVIQDGLSCFLRSHAFLCTKLYQLIYISLCFLVFLWIYNSSFGDIQSLAAFLYCLFASDDDQICKSSFRICAAASYVLLSSDSGSTIVFLFCFCSCFNCVNKSHDLLTPFDKFTRYSHCSTLFALSQV